MEQEYNFRCG